VGDFRSAHSSVRRRTFWTTAAIIFAVAASPIFRFVSPAPQRSFCINGQPMAVCSRCFGIYSSFGLGWLGLPLLAQLKERLIPSARTLLIAAVFLNILDFLGNLLGFWHNTLVSRMVAGSTVGLLAATFLSTSFFHIN